MSFNLFRKKVDPFWPAFKWQDLLILLGGITVFVGIAASTVTKFSIWFDEAFGSYLIRYDFVSLTRYTANDVHPPFYYWCLKLWSMAFGNTELGLRSMSIFFGAVTIVFAFLLILKLFGRRAAYTALLFLVLSPMFIRYSQEARMYTLLTAIVVAATYVLVYAQAHVKKRWLWVVYGVLLALGMLTQYFAALAWLSHWAWRFVTVRVKGEKWGITSKKFFTREWVWAHALAIGIFLPWLPFMAIQFLTIQGHGFWIKPVTSATLPNFLTNFLLFQDHAGVTSWLAMAFYIVCILVGYLIFRLHRQLEGRDRMHYNLLLCMILVPIVLLFVLSMPPLTSAFVDRYLLGVVVFLALLLGVTLAISKGILSRTLRVFTGIVIIALMIVGIGAQMTIGNYNKSSGQSNNVRQLLEKVRSTAAPGTPIISSSPWIYYEASIYSTTDSPVYYVHETTEYKYGSLTMLAENEQGKIRDLDTFTDTHKTFWIIANLNETQPRALRDDWRETNVIVVNDDLTGKPLFKAVQFNVE